VAHCTRCVERPLVITNEVQKGEVWRQTWWPYSLFINARGGVQPRTFAQRISTPNTGAYLPVYLARSKHILMSSGQRNKHLTGLTALLQQIGQAFRRWQINTINQFSENREKGIRPHPTSCSAHGTLNIWSGGDHSSEIGVLPMDIKFSDNKKLMNIAWRYNIQ
jgi:hypothetical protein